MEEDFEKQAVGEILFGPFTVLQFSGAVQAGLLVRVLTAKAASVEGPAVPAGLRREGAHIQKGFDPLYVQTLLQGTDFQHLRGFADPFAGKEIPVRGDEQPQLPGNAGAARGKGFAEPHAGDNFFHIIQGKLKLRLDNGADLFGGISSDLRQQSQEGLILSCPDFPLPPPLSRTGSSSGKI